MPLLETVRQAMMRCSPPLAAAGELVLAAVSGGPDSLSLLHALHSLSSEIGFRALHVAHFEHGLRGMESVADAEFVARFCANLGVPFHVGHGDVAALAKSARVSKQIAARIARYEYLDEIATQIGADKVATAHNQDDQIETILLNILRGTGLRGLQGIPIQRGRYIRPLLAVSRAEVMAYCAEHSLTPREDPSNHSTAYTRNRLRHELLPLLERDYNPAVGEALLRLARIAERDLGYLASEAESLLPTLTLTCDSMRLVLDCARLRELHPAMLRHVLRAALLQCRSTLEAITHEHLEPVCEAVMGQRRLPFGLTTPAPHYAIRVTQRRISFIPLPASEPSTSPAANI